MVSLRYLLTACGTIFQEKQPNFVKIRQCHMNQSVFHICLVAQFVKILLQTPGMSDEGQMIFLAHSYKKVLILRSVYHR